MTKQLTEDQRTISDLYGVTLTLAQLPGLVRDSVIPLFIDYDLPLPVREKLREVLAWANTTKMLVDKMKQIAEAALAHEEG